MMQITKKLIYWYKDKIRIFKTLSQPRTLYRSKVWFLTKSSKRKLMTFETKQLRKIFGPIGQEEEMVTKISRELRGSYTNPDIIAIIKSKRLRWLGRVTS